VEEQRDIDGYRRVYRLAKKRLRTAIIAAKARAWGELLTLINEDPWGLPYKLVLGKLRPVSRALTESLEPPMVRAMVDGLFPGGVETDPGMIWTVPSWDEQCTVTAGEIRRMMKDGTNNAAPGLDGIPLTVLKLVPDEMIEQVAETRVTRNA